MHLRIQPNSINNNKKNTNNNNNNKKKNGDKKLKKAKTTVITRTVKSSPLPSVPLQNTLSPCGAKFLHACSEPFHMNSYGACIPHWPSPPSGKYEMMITGVMTIGQGGVGFIAASPCLTGITSSTPSLYVSNADYVHGHIVINTTSVNPGNPTAVPPVASGGVDVLNTPSAVAAYIGANNGAAAQVHGRVVAGGIEAFYIGRNDDRAGMYIAVHSETHSNLNGMGFSNLERHAGAGLVKRVTDAKFGVNFHPINSNELNYDADSGSSSSSEQRGVVWPYGGYDEYLDPSMTNNGPVIAALVVQGPPNAQFRYRYIMHYEATGARSVLVNTTRDMPAPQDIPIVTSTIEKAQAYVRDGTAWVKAAKDGLIDTLRQINPNAAIRSVEVAADIASMVGGMATSPYMRVRY